MKMTSLLCCYSFLILVTALSCSQTESTSKKLNSPAQQNSIRNDEKSFPVEHHYLVLKNRAVIRPIYVETIENVKAVHKGYLIHIELLNKARTTSYKDIKIEITYFSKEKTILNKEYVLIKQLVKSGSALKISKKVLHYKNTNYKVAILSASPLA
jgi:hypothetical protein